VPNDRRDAGRGDEFVRSQNLRPTRAPSDDTHRLAAHVRSAAEYSRPRIDCPDSERIWSAVSLELPLDARLAVIDHVSECPLCAEAWSIAAELVPERDETQRTSAQALSEEEEAPFWVRGSTMPSSSSILRGRQRVRSTSRVVEGVPWRRKAIRAYLSTSPFALPVVLAAMAILAFAVWSIQVDQGVEPSAPRVANGPKLEPRNEVDATSPILPAAEPSAPRVANGSKLEPRNEVDATSLILPAAESSAPRLARGPMLEPRTEAGVTYPRDNLWLRWNPGPDGSKYDLIVTTANKEVVIQARDLETTDYLIATERLVNVPTGATLSWQVVAHTPQGTTLSSRTFEVLVHASSTIPPGPRQDASSLGIGQIGQALILDSPDFREVFEKTSDSGSALLACDASERTALR
jgi:hypothetical protein